MLIKLAKKRWLPLKMLYLCAPSNPNNPQAIKFHRMIPILSLDKNTLTDKRATWKIAPALDAV